MLDQLQTRGLEAFHDDKTRVASDEALRYGHHERYEFSDLIEPTCCICLSRPKILA